MFPDFKELIALLNKHKVRYLVVGGYAVARHAQPRATKDLDILVQTTPKNAAAVYAALVEEFGAPLRTRAGPDGEPHPLTRKLIAKDFEDKGTWYTMGVPPVAIDILSEIQGVSFNAAWKNRVTMVIDDAAGLMAHFISRDDLIANKLAAGRLRDLADVDEIHRATGTAARHAEPASGMPRGVHRKTPRAKPKPRRSDR
jgi:hypothetical protein